MSISFSFESNDSKSEPVLMSDRASLRGAVRFRLSFVWHSAQLLGYVLDCIELFLLRHGGTFSGNLAKLLDLTDDLSSAASALTASRSFLDAN